MEALMNDHCTCQQLRLISGASNRLMLNLNRKSSASSYPGLSQKEGWEGEIASQPEWWHHFSKRTRSWQVNWNHHWCYLFSNAPRLTGDILFGTHPKGERGAQRFSAPSRADSRSVLTPKQWDSLETCSGICHNPAPHGENTNALSSLFTHISRSVAMLVSHLNICHNIRKQEIVCYKKESLLKILFFVLDKCQQKFNLWEGSVLQMLKHRWDDT